MAERIYRKNHKIKQSINQAEPGLYFLRSGKRSLGEIGGKDEQTDQDAINAHEIYAGHHGHEPIGFAENAAQVADINDSCPHTGVAQKPDMNASPKYSSKKYSFLLSPERIL